VKILGEHETDLLALALEVAKYHHEKWDGSGYPNGLSGEDIPLSARIVAIADVFDALTSVRPYKKAWSVEKAMALIESEAGSHFDPILVPKFKDCLPEILEIKAKYMD
jgi:putative two-component system response regulator